ncbi:MAG: hypothetical protein CMA12_08340 [Euryarchaeota archaeon]|nr:hypothetical protein [Euryarchaeota archaeon]
MNKLLILGARSYLGSEFCKFLSKLNIDLISVTEENHDGYTFNNLKKVFETEQPNIIVDFKFPKVSSNDDDYVNINKNELFLPQENLFNVLTNLDYEFKKIVLISSQQVDQEKSIYAILKKQQEDIYKKNFKSDNKLNIFRLTTTYGPRDLSDSRLIPHFFREIITNKFIELNITNKEFGEYIFIDDAMNYIWDICQNKSIDQQNIMKIRYKDLITTFMFILNSKHNFSPKVIWNGQEIQGKNCIQNIDHFKNINNTVEWYLESLFNNK